ncbi:hypothetical protein VTI74DRAFT_9639 [Chaetomium olivicolor]
MMRRGLWQQKQKRPTACLLCRFTYGYGPYTRPAPRPSSSPDGTVSADSARLYSGLANRRGDGASDSLGSPRIPAGLGPAVGPGKGSLFQRSFSSNDLPTWMKQPAKPADANNPLPSWATASRDAPPTPSGDGLLPHERAARERGMARKQQPPPTPSSETKKPPLNKDGLLPDEPFVIQRGMRRGRPQRPPRGNGRQNSRNDGLPRNEGAARERQMGRQPFQGNRATDPKPATSSVPGDGTARDSALPRAPPRLTTPQVTLQATPVTEKPSASATNAVPQLGPRTGAVSATKIDSAPAAEPVVAPATTADAVPALEAETVPATEVNSIPAPELETVPSTKAEGVPAMATEAAPTKESEIAPANESETAPAKEPKTASATKPDVAPASPRPTPAPTAAPSWASSAPSWSPAAPSWSSPAAPSPTAVLAAENPPQRADSLAGLLPHERAARDRALARKQPAPAAPAPTTPTTPPPVPDSLASRTLEPHDDMAREYVSLQSRRRRPFGLAYDILDDEPKQAPQFSSPSTTFQRRADKSGQARNGTSRSRSDGNELPPLPSFDLPRPSNILSRAQAEEGEWKNLARRERNAAFDFSPSSLQNAQRAPSSTAQSSSEPTPAPTPPPSTAPSGDAPNTGADPFQRLTQTAEQTTQKSSPNAGEDQWALLEKKLAEEKKAAKKAKQSASDTWDWADQYTEEAKRLKAQKLAREIAQQEGQAPEPSADPWSDTTSSRRGDRAAERGERPRRGERGDRYDREERIDLREKPKNKSRRRNREMDDEWDEEYEERRRRREERAKRRDTQVEAEEPEPTPIFLPEYISVANLATALGQKVDIFVQQLEELGFEDVGKDNILTGETAALVAQEYGFEPTVDTGDEEDLKPRPPPEDPSSLPLRPPVVTIMGHVDHGKTTLLDYLRKSSIVSQEHGGITQHIGAFSVSLSSGKLITFLDTPGHAAFLSMRQRGANVTDMIILVVAADDSVMPQTLEALKHARAAKVPIIVAINKVDKPEANIERVKADLANHGVEIEDYGGDVQVVCVSGKTGQGMNDLEENILLLSEMLDIRAETDGMAEGWVLESTIKPIGRVATVLVKRGTLRPGDFIVAGRVHAKIRSLRNEAGVEVDEAPPGTAVEVLGWKEPPDAGDQVLQAPDEGRAKAAVRYRQELKERGEVIGQMAQIEQERREREAQRERERAVEDADPRAARRRGGAGASAGLDENPDDAGAEDEGTPRRDMTKYVTFLVKGDVHGSVEAVTAALMEQGNNEIRAKVLVSAPGQITESDVEHAAVSGSYIINFNNSIPNNIKRLAYEAGVKILDHNVIYHLVEEVREKLADALPLLVIKKVVGEAEVLQVFPINVKGRKYKNIAGCRIGNGVVKKGSKARVIRGGENIFEGVIETLKHVKKDVTEMKKGSECGMSFADWDELQAGDLIQVIEEHTEKRKL